VLCEYVPAGQKVGAPEPVQKVPAGQAVQTTERAKSVYVPRPQVVHDDEPGVAAEPMGQFWHVAALVAPATALAVPPGQAVQVCAPAAEK